ncbi:chromosome partitioning protein, ParB family [Roseovarius lutimaris]|uniref:Chromosome partitioning protein, ParB family n=1 Tax=Roseovarius lutimaris TaxID=1005928 RepID=A0A1I4YT94_9RHOB|nr:ParB/RepB/Spo0J family partition protein [Roseovarius lutimaris]SFN41268.1 chromosome partitioning protein, ParB family [Roseovarius lutimaris]
MASKKTQQRGLGRGLSALMADVGDDARATAGDGAKHPDLMVPVEKVQPNPDQPRRSFDQELLQDLANSIAEKGVIQPLIVRMNPRREGEYEIVAGERRWRAAQMAKLHEIPVLVREFNDTEVLEVAIIENIQRADLNPVEEATGYNQLMHKFGHTQEKLAEVLGKSRSHIANCVRLLNLPEEVLIFLREGKLSSGHARALITAEDPASLARQVIKKNLSVRETEKLAKTAVGNIFNESGTTAKPRRPAAKDADTMALEGDLAANLGMKVTINHASGQENGQITISYDTLDQLDKLCGLLSS